MPPKRAREMSALEVSRLGNGRHAVGGVAGLYLYVDGNARSWVLRMKVGGRRREAGLGPHPEVRLAKAREIAARYRESVREGNDPFAERDQRRREIDEAQARAISFRDAARKVHKTKSAEFRSDKHRRDWINSLENYAFPSIGSVPVASVDRGHVMRVLEPIWTSKTETATRVRQRIEAVLDWAKVSGYRDGDNPAAWRGNLEALLPRPQKVRRVEHWPALPFARVPEFMNALRQREGLGARALEFIILTVARSREIRYATWREVDRDAALWTIPGERMKTGKPHSIPLSPPAIALLEAIPRTGDDEFVFPGARDVPISDATITATIKRMHADEQRQGRGGWIDPNSGRRITAHGFRSAFKDWSRACTQYPDEASELALAHVNDDKTRAAYARDELLEMRRGLMGEWATYTDFNL
jgi:integrase